MKEFDSVIPAGGRGSRLKEIRGATPKPVFSVGGKELIRHSIDSLPPDLFNRLVIVLNEESEQIEEWLQSAQLSIPYIICHQEGIGVLGAITSGAKKAEKDQLLACNSDEIRVGLDLEDVIRFHKKSGKLATMVAARTNNLWRHRVLQINPKDNTIVGSKMRSEEFRLKPNSIDWVNAGIIVMHKRAMEQADPAYSSEWSGIIDPLCNSGQIVAYKSNIVYFNINTPEEYREAQEYFQLEPVSKSQTVSFTTPPMR